MSSWTMSSSTRHSDVTVISVMAWQLRHHLGFVLAVMKSFRYGHIHERNEEWERLGAMLADRRDNPSYPACSAARCFSSSAVRILS